jgi:hypothetical protein
MVDMRVGQDDRVEILDWERQLAILVSRFLPAALKHAAVQRYRMPVYPKQMARAGNLPRRTYKSYFQADQPSATASR